MFSNIGGKIKVLAVVMCILGMVASLAIGVIVIIGGGFLRFSGSYGSAGTAATIVGILIIIFGCLFSWIGSFVLYGYGELIAKMMETADNTRNMLFAMQQKGGGSPSGFAPVPPFPEPPVQPQPEMNIAAGPVTCPSCGAVNSPDVNFCVNCGNPLH